MLYIKNDRTNECNIITIEDTQSLDDVYNLLAELKNEKTEEDMRYICVEYKGNYFFDVDIEKGIDDLYERTYGMNKKEYQQWEIVKRGIKCIYPQHDVDWRHMFETGFHTLQYLSTLTNIFEAIEKDDTFASALEMVKQHRNDPGVYRHIQKYSKKGPEFIDFILKNYPEVLPDNIKNDEKKLRRIVELNEKQKEVNKILEAKHEKQFAYKIPFYEKDSIETLFSVIRQTQNREDRLIFEYKGAEIESDTITSIDDIYIKLYSLPKNEYELSIKKEEAKVEMPFLISSGIKKGYIQPNKIEQWENCVRSYSLSDSCGVEIRLALSYMKKAQNGIRIDYGFLSNYPNDVIQNVIDIIYEYSVLGPTYWDKTGLNQVQSKNDKPKK